MGKTVSHNAVGVTFTKQCTGWPHFAFAHLAYLFATGLNFVNIRHVDM